MPRHYANDVGNGFPNPRASSTAKALASDRRSPPAPCRSGAIGNRTPRHPNRLAATTDSLPRFPATDDLPKSECRQSRIPAWSESAMPPRPNSLRGCTCTWSKARNLPGPPSSRFRLGCDVGACCCAGWSARGNSRDCRFPVRAGSGPSMGHPPGRDRHCCLPSEPIRPGPTTPRRPERPGNGLNSKSRNPCACQWSRCKPGNRVAPTPTRATTCHRERRKRPPRRTAARAPWTRAPPRRPTTSRGCTNGHPRARRISRDASPGEPGRQTRVAKERPAMVRKARFPDAAVSTRPQAGAPVRMPMLPGTARRRPDREIGARRNGVSKRIRSARRVVRSWPAGNLPGVYN